MRLVILDTETTGLDPDQGHRVIEIGCVEVVNRQLTQRQFHCYLNPERAVDVEAFNVHGLSDEFLSEQALFADEVDRFLAFVKDAEVIIHNADFDVKFLNAELARLGRGVFKDYCHHVTDSLAVARSMHPGKRNSLDALCARYEISNEHRKWHGALLDAELLADVWLAMTRGQNSLVMEISDTNSDGSKQHIMTESELASLPVFVPSPEDVALHEAYLVSMEKESKKEPLWKTWAHSKTFLETSS